MLTFSTLCVKERRKFHTVVRTIDSTMHSSFKEEFIFFRDDEICLDRTTGKVEIAFSPDYDSSDSRETYDLRFCQGKQDNFVLGQYKTSFLYLKI